MKSIVTIIAMSVIGTLSAQAVLIADFDSGSKPNNVGGDFGAWDKDPADNSQYAREAFSRKVTRNGQGASMEITYDVDSPKAAYNGFWMKLGNLDARDKSQVVFWAKGDEKKGCTERFKVELKTAGERGSFYVDGVTTEWTKVVIPLDEFNITDMSQLDELVIVFEDHTSRPKEGILYIDDVVIE